MYEVRRYNRTTRFTIFCIAVLVGLILARKATPPTPILLIPVGVFTLFSFKKARIFSVYSLFVLGLMFGWWRGSVVMRDIRYAQSISRERITIHAKALNDAIYDDKKQLSFDVNEAVVEGEKGKNIIGKIGVSGFGEKMVYRGDRVVVEGKFFPGRGSYTGYISFANMKVASRSKSLVYTASRKFSAGLQNALPEPYASFGLGILIGQRNTLPDNVSASLSLVGLTHIIAVSGYNLTIIVDSVRRLIGKRSRFQTWITCQLLIMCFLLVTGFSASIVRAGLISTLSLGAWYYGRSFKPLLLLMLSAAITASWNPVYIWSDIGWYLSFFAFYGVLIIGPLIKQRLGLSDKHALSGIIVETISAQIVTLPLILYIFNSSHFLALPANVLVLPFIPLAMLLTFVSGAVGAIAPAIVGWISWPARLLLTYIIDIASFFGRVPHMSYKVSFGNITLAFMYIIIILVTIILWQINQRSAKITEVNEK